MRQKIKQIVTMMMALVIIGNTLVVFAQRPYRVNDRQVEQLIRRIENRTDSFRRYLDSSLNRNRLSGTAREDEINNYILDFEGATDRLKDRFIERQPSSTEVRDVLERASLIDNFIRVNLRSTTAERSWNTLRSDLNTLANYFNVTWNWNTTNSPSSHANTRYNNYGNTCLVGTYRLDVSRSDDPARIATRATTNVDSLYQDRVRNSLERRLEAPEMLALELSGQNITVASSQAPKVTLTVDGQTRTEQNERGRSTTVKASMNRDIITVTTTGDRNNDFIVTFEPMDNCRRLRVTRTLSNNRLSQPVVAQSVYERISERPQWELSVSGDGFPQNRQRYQFTVPDGTQMIAVLDSDLNTKEVQDGDFLTMTVRSPQQYEGAVIEGTISEVQRSGRVTGRAGLSINFERIRLRNGQVYDFAGTLENVRAVDGQTVRVDPEGSVQNETSQTRDTITRTGIGAALGAIIGAMAGGGKGAAIGATVGAGAGAGSVIVQGRDDLVLKRGTEVILRASAPR